MSKIQETVREIEMLIADGETEKAILLLKEVTQDGGFKDRELYKNVLLLAGQYNSWERNRMKGLEADSKELARISDQVLDLSEELMKPPSERVTATPPPPPTASPDPLRMAQTYTPPTHPRPAAKEEGLNKQFGGYLKGFLIVCGAILVIAFIVELVNPTEDDPTTSGSFPTETTVAEPGPNGSGGETTTTPPTNTPTKPPSTGGNDTESIRRRMMEYAGTGRELSPADLRPINYATLEEQLGGTSWYNNMTGTIYFGEDGISANYLDGYGQVEIISGTRQGFFIANYAESNTGDAGLVALVPPNDGDLLHIYVESSMTGNTLQYSATRY